MKAPAPSGKKEPEDIFADLDHGSGPAPAPAPVFDVPERKSPLKLILITLVILVLVAAGGVAVWYFLIRSETPAGVETPSSSSNPPVVTAESEPVVEVPVVQPEDQPAPPTTTPPPNVPPPQPVGTPAIQPQPTEAPDTDNDGLSDPEELALSTDPTQRDTDHDGFTDGAELMSGYDPAAERTSLESSTHFHALTIANAWSVLLPTGWTVGLDAAAPGDYAIQTGTPTEFTVHVGQKDPTTTFNDWLATNDPTADPSVLRSITTRAGYPAWESLNRLVTYIVTDTSVLVIHYRVNAATSYDYRAIYDYVIQTIRQL